MLGAGDLEELLGAVARHASRLVRASMCMEAVWILDFVPSDLARLLGGLGELRHRNQLLLEKAANRLSVSLIPMVQLTCEDVAKVWVWLLGWDGIGLLRRLYVPHKRVSHPKLLHRYRTEGCLTPSCCSSGIYF
eukprot:scaffold156898_cov21-Tisochrysis_lutea.AAC.1